MTEHEAGSQLKLLDDRVPGADVRRSITVGAASQLAAKVLHLVLNVVSTLAVVRYLVPAAYGVYAVVLLVTTLVTFVADAGLPKIAVREICAGSDEERTVGTVLAMRVMLSLAGIVVSEVLLLVLQQPRQALAAAAIASLTGVGEAVLASAVVAFQVRLVQQWEAVIRAGTELVETAAIVMLVVRHASLAMLFVPPAAMTAVGGLTALALVRYHFACRPRVDRSQVRNLVRFALPVTPALLVSVLYRKMDSVSLAALRPGRQIGWYSSAAQPVEYLFLTTALLMNTVYPLMAAAHAKGDIERFTTLYRRGAETLIILTVGVPVVLAFVAPHLVRAVFGTDYAPAATPLVLLSAASVPLTVTVWQSLALLIGGFQMVTLHYNLATLVVSAVLCFSLVATTGMTGAGCAAIGTAVFALAAATRAVRRHLGLTLSGPALARVAVAAALTAGVLALVRVDDPAWPFVTLVGVVGFVVAVRVTGAHRSVTGLVT